MVGQPTRSADGPSLDLCTSSSPKIATRGAAAGQLRAPRGPFYEGVDELQKGIEAGLRQGRGARQTLLQPLLAHKSHESAVAGS